MPGGHQQQDLSLPVGEAEAGQFIGWPRGALAWLVATACPGRGSRVGGERQPGPAGQGGGLARDGGGTERVRDGICLLDRLGGRVPVPVAGARLGQAQQSMSDPVHSTVLLTSFSMSSGSLSGGCGRLLLTYI